MLDRLEIPQTEETPGVILDKSKGIFQFTGKSLPENASDFFSVIIAWFRDYCGAPNKETDLIFQMDYLNSSTARKFMEIFILLEDEISNGSSVNVKWQYHKNDKMIEEGGKEFSAVVDLPFEFSEY